MKYKRALFFCLLISAFGVMAFIPRQDGGIAKLVSPLQQWTKANPHEKVHLHLDKPYYALGDTIWFKAYVTVGSRHQLSALSGALYVELIDSQDSLIKDLKLPVVSGTTYGDFMLDEELNTGNYRIRAYTQWMRNAGEDYFYDQTFMVGAFGAESDVLVDGEQAAKNVKGNGRKKGKQETITHAQADVQFFPESGNLVNGIASRVGFKAVGSDGVGIAVKGIIMDDADKEIINFQSHHAGMGNVVLKPQPGKAYRVKVVFPDSTTRIMDLPKALDSGYVLSIYQPNKDSILIRINESARNDEKTPQSLNLMVHSGGEIIFAAPVTINRSITSIWLHKASLPSGIAQFTLLNAQNEPLNERIAFIRTNDRMKLSLSTAKQSYKSREPVDISLMANDGDGNPTGGSFSVSVIDESKVPFDDAFGHSIFSNLLLSSELKGYIENPNYYFNKETGEVEAALDNLMLTQGYRRFDWKAVTHDSLAKPRFPAEGIGTIFSGKVLSLNGKPQPNASVTMMALKANLIKNTTADIDGRFKFDEAFVLTDSMRITFQGKSQKNSTKVELILDSVEKMGAAKARKMIKANEQLDTILKTYIDNSKRLDSIYAKTGQFNRVRRLKEVNIKARKIDQRYTVQGSLRVPEGHSDLAIDMKNEKNFASMESFIREKLMGRGIKFKPYRPDSLGPEVMYYPHAEDPVRRILVPMSVIVDGRRLDPKDAIDVFNNSSLDQADIAKIEVIVTSAALAAMVGGPSIMFYTKADKFVKKPGFNVVNITPRGFNKVKSFYHPKYDRANTSSLPDLRSTIHWNPDLRIYPSGKTSINYFNADGPGSYKVIVEGINEKGELGRAVYRYEVEADVF